MFTPLLNENQCWVKDEWVEGEIPKALQGTYFRNGPALFPTGPNSSRHPFDGDGNVSAFTFYNGRIFYRNQYVRTDAFVKEQEAGRVLFRDPFTKGAADGNFFFNPFDLDFKSKANTGVVHWAGKLLALYESSLPYQLDPASLSTIGPSDLDGAIRAGPLAAHYRVVTSPDGTRRLVSFGTRTRPPAAPVAAFYEWREDGTLAARREVELPVDGPLTMVHDLAVTESFYVIVVPPLRVDAGRMLRYALSQCSIAETLAFDQSRPAKAVLVPREGQTKYPGLTEPIIIDLPPCFVFHHVNAFETPDGRHVVLDTSKWDTLDFTTEYDTVEYFKGGQRSQLTRVTLDLQQRSATQQRLLRRTAEFACVNWSYHARSHSHIFAVADAVDHEVLWGPPQTLVKLTLSQSAAAPALLTGADVAVEGWAAGPRCLFGEPVFVPREGGLEEDDGWLLVVVYRTDEGTSDLCILDAKRVSEGPVATVHFPFQLGYGLHGSFTPDTFVPQSERVDAPPRPVRAI